MKDVPLTEIEMSVRLDNILRKVGGYEWLSEINDQALNKIRLQKGCGKKSYKELTDILAYYKEQKQNEYAKIVKEHDDYLNAIINFKRAFYELIDLAHLNWRKSK
jgi:hypothetical protein